MVIYYLPINKHQLGHSDRIFARDVLKLLKEKVFDENMRIKYAPFKSKPSAKMRKLMEQGYRENADEDLAVAKELDAFSARRTSTEKEVEN